LIAGPIVRLSHLADQLNQRERTWEDFAIGASRFTWGLGKKVLIADVCSKLANSVFDHDLDRLPPAAAWLALLAYTLQIYFGFLRLLRHGHRTRPDVRLPVSGEFSSSLHGCKHDGFLAPMAHEPVTVVS